MRDRRNDYDMGSVSRMPHSKEEAEQQKVQGVQADSGHHARAKRSEWRGREGCQRSNVFRADPVAGSHIVPAE